MKKSGLPRLGPRITEVRGCGSRNPQKEIRDMNKQLEIPTCIKEYEGGIIDEKEFNERLDEMSELAFDDQCTGANPRYPLISEIKQMYLNAYYGGAK